MIFDILVTKLISGCYQHGYFKSNKIERLYRSLRDKKVYVLVH